MTKEEKLAEALEGSRQAAETVRFLKRTACGQAATGHIPFPGHRTVATVWAQQAAARKRERELRPLMKAMEYGLDPDSLKASER